MADQQIDLERVRREKEAYNSGLEREGYESALSHTFHLYEKRRQDLIRRTFQPLEDGDFLELGSSVWLPWLEETGVRPRKLVCINISEAEMELGAAPAAYTTLKPDFQIMDAHELAFEDNSFDVVYGGGMLHHLEYERALKEIRRVLRPGGHMIFREPMDVNPVGRIVRALTPRARTEDEKPLRLKDIAIARSLFEMTFHYEQLVTVPAGVLSRLVFKSPDNVLMRSAFGFDEWLVRTAPAIGPLYREVWMVGRKPAEA